MYTFYAGDEREIKSLLGIGEHFIIALERSSSCSFGMDDYHTYYGGGRFRSFTLHRSVSCEITT